VIPVYRGMVMVRVRQSSQHVIGAERRASW